MPPKKEIEQLEETKDPSSEEMREEIEEFDPEGLVEKSPEELIMEDIEKLKQIKTKIISVITVNQKYIKKNFEEIKDLKDNFKILLEKSK